MTTNHQQQNLSEPLSSEETREILERISEREGNPRPRVEDIAEVLRLEVDDVKVLLAEVRATPPKAVEEPRQSRTSPLAYLGWCVAAAAVAWAARRPQPVVSPPAAVPTPVPAMPGAAPIRPLQEVAVVPMELSPPAGYDIGVKANGVVLNLAGRRDVRPKGASDSRKALVDALTLLVQRANEIGASHAFEPGQTMVEPGFSANTEVWINGPGTSTSFQLPAQPYTGSAAITTLKEWRAAIEASVGAMTTLKHPAVGPETGTVGTYFPPSGFQVMFKGRRTAGMNSSPVAPEPVDQAAARERMYLAMRAMMDADLKPVEGRWRQDAEIEAKLKTPDTSHFTIDTIDGKMEFDVPTKPGTPRAEQDRVLREKAAQAIRDYVRRGKG